MKGKSDAAAVPDNRYFPAVQGERKIIDNIPELGNVGQSNIFSNEKGIP
jgi:hypothetical protein